MQEGRCMFKGFSRSPVALFLSLFIFWLPHRRVHAMGADPLLAHLPSPTYTRCQIRSSIDTCSVNKRGPRAAGGCVCMTTVWSHAYVLCVCACTFLSPSPLKPALKSWWDIFRLKWLPSILDDSFQRLLSYTRGFKCLAWFNQSSITKYLLNI